MIGEPQLQQRGEQQYAGIRNRVPMDELPTVIPRSIGEVLNWLGQNGVAPVAAPFVRYYTIDMPRMLDIDVGVPLASTPITDARVHAASLPAGRYAVLLYTGPYDGLMQANAALLDWIQLRGLTIDTHTTSDGEAFAARLESYLTDPAEEPDPAQWQTEVAIKLAN